MKPSGKSFLMGAASGVVATMFVALLVALAFAYGGLYNVAASDGHMAGTRWLLDSSMHSSVRRRAADPNEDQRIAQADVRAGAADYKAMCEHCHGGPGVEPARWSRGMLPRPPHLTEAAAEWEPGQIAWIVRHGVKYTGMPSFETGHDDEAIWNIAAFVDTLPGMTPQAYQDLGDGRGSAHADHESHKPGT